MYTTEDPRMRTVPAWSHRTTSKNDQHVSGLKRACFTVLRLCCWLLFWRERKSRRRETKGPVIRSWVPETTLPQRKVYIERLYMKTVVPIGRVKVNPAWLLEFPLLTYCYMMQFLEAILVKLLSRERAFSLQNRAGWLGTYSRKYVISLMYTT